MENEHTISLLGRIWQNFQVELSSPSPPLEIIFVGNTFINFHQTELEKLKKKKINKNSEG
jgi:hypothetical protein